MSSQQGAAGAHLQSPYPPKTAALGGVPTVHLDVPITAVYLALFVGAAIGHMTIFQLNKRRGHKFIMSGLMFGFCMARITTCVMRIVWATRPTQIPVAIAAMIFVTAGVVLLFVINLIFAQRIVRAAHPNLGWHALFSKAFVAIYVLIVAVLMMLIAATVYSFYTLSPTRHRICRDIQLFGGAFYMVIAFLPFPLVIGGLVIPRKTRLEKFGTGRWRTKVAILLTATFLLCLGAAFRSGTNFKTPRPRNDPAWYQSKACFYIFDLGVEVIVIYLYLLVRVDLRFYVPNGSHQAGDYSGRNLADKEAVEGENQRPKFEERIMSEEEVFDDEMPEDTEQAKKDEERALQ